MIKEKLVFWLLLFVLLIGLGYGLSIRANKKIATDELIKDFESTQVKAKKTLKLTKEYEIDELKQESDLKVYEGLIKRSPFFRVVSEGTPRKIVEVVKQVIEEGPKQVQFIYKGRVQMGTVETVIIEEQITGKSYFVKMGDKIGEYEVVIDEDKIILKKKGAEDIILGAKEGKDK